jgi:hypothetical protein
VSSGFRWGIITLVKAKKLTATERKLKELLALNIAKSLGTVTPKKPEPETREPEQEPLEAAV